MKVVLMTRPLNLMVMEKHWENLMKSKTIMMVKEMMKTRENQNQVKTVLRKNCQ